VQEIENLDCLLLKTKVLLLELLKSCKIDDIEDDNIDYLEPKQHISKEEIRDFFQEKLRNISKLK